MRREEILIRKGVTRRTSRHSGRNADNLSAYSKKAAADLGVDERTVRRDLARGKKIAPDVLAEVADLEPGGDLEPSLSFTLAMDQDNAIRWERVGVDWIDAEDACEDEGAPTGDDEPDDYH
ncbi:MAG: hypothetical protein ACK5XY_03745 [Brevundimonas sp.]